LLPVTEVDSRDGSVSRREIEERVTTLSKVIDLILTGIHR